MLLDELEQLFVAEGFAHLSVADLAARLQVSRSTLYRLATGKQELAELVISRMFDRMGESVRVALEDAADPAARVAACLGNGAASARTGGLEFSRDMEANPGTRAICDRRQAFVMSMLEGLIEDGVRSGGFRPVPAALVVQVADAARTRLRDSTVLVALGMTYAEAIDTLTSILLNGISGPGTTASSGDYPAG